AMGCRRGCAADCLRERREPYARSRSHAAEGNCVAPGAGSRAVGRDAETVDRKRRARYDRRRARRVAWLVGAVQVHRMQFYLHHTEDEDVMAYMPVCDWLTAEALKWLLVGSG